MLDIHTVAPEFSLPDQDGIVHTLAENRGYYTLVYFYPKDDTPGCTKEACTIAEAYQDFLAHDTRVFGISADSIESHKKFQQKYNLPFTLLADTEKVAIAAYGADGLLGTKRISYLIDKEGIIVKAYPDVTPSEHGAEILKDLHILNK